ncbi:hypothetical protein [Thauera propionica]|uniref:hypothetical protein n=1 Tax=Thauera propionica TaxID=2019431 RepID=UPI001054C964|nr:hypothetical protein [Thauera propionica]
MNSLKAIALMAHLLAKSASKYQVGNRPNASAISDGRHTGGRRTDAQCLLSFNKKLSEALKLFGPEINRHRT